MQQISKIAETQIKTIQQPRGQKEQQSYGGTAEDKVAKVWTQMSETYGRKFTDSFGFSPNQSWYTVISSMTDEQIHNAWIACVKMNLDWPPDLVQFYNLGVGKKKWDGVHRFTQQMSKDEEDRQDKIARKQLGLPSQHKGGGYEAFRKALADMKKNKGKDKK